MTKPKHVSTTLKNILENPVMVAISDKTNNIDKDVIEEVLGYWKYDLLSRKAGRAVTEASSSSSIDLATYLYSLADRKAVINLPEYKTKRSTTITEGQTRISGDGNRHGKILGLISNKDVFTFSIRMEDMSIIDTNDEQDKLGAYRTFLMTDFDGGLYDGWKSIQFVPNAEENKWIFENQQSINGKITVDHFVNPNKWISFYGQYYFCAKALIYRLTDENKNLRGQLKAMLDAGIQWPEDSDYGKKMEWPKKTKIKGETEKVWGLEVELDIPEYESQYPEYEMNTENMVKVFELNRYYNKCIEKLRFLTRSVECAFAMKHTKEKCEKGEFTYPSWIQNFGWEEGFRFHGKRIEWYRLKLAQPGVGELSVALRFRWKQTTQDVKTASSDITDSLAVV